MELIVGLGNPGREYEETRHNVGFMVLESLASECRTVLRKERGEPYAFAPARLGQKTVFLATPRTFMNLSGRAVVRLLGKTGVDPSRLVVVHDDIDLGLGRIRIKARGGHGGQKGVLSIISALKTDQFYRLRVGIGRPPEGWEVADYVLSPFGRAERPVLAEVVDESVSALRCMVEEGGPEAMNRFNRHKQHKGLKS